MRAKRRWAGWFYLRLAYWRALWLLRGWGWAPSCVGFVCVRKRPLSRLEVAAVQELIAELERKKTEPTEWRVTQRSRPVPRSRTSR